ncbi:MAG: D-tyrosyl-tRNA(Tyr) deacylase, partial [Bacteroidales bacterium]|nr:D-tyrosyl-tRNA(Tyr) deacylase [Bacteroidales bacterium]
LRIFPDSNGVMNLSALEVNANLLIVSQFTLHAKTKKGNRPSYILSAPPEISVPLYNSFIKKCENIINKPIATGVFGADMQVTLCNDGPVTIMIDSKNKDL